MHSFPIWTAEGPAGRAGAADGRRVVSLRKALVAKLDPVTIGGAIAGVAAVGSVTYIAIKERWGSTPAASPAPVDAAAQPAAGAKSDASGAEKSPTSPFRRRDIGAVGGMQWYGQSTIWPGHQR